LTQSLTGTSHQTEARTLLETPTVKSHQIAAQFSMSALTGTSPRRISG